MVDSAFTELWLDHLPNVLTHVIALTCTEHRFGLLRGTSADKDKAIGLKALG